MHFIVPKYLPITNTQEHLQTHDQSKLAMEIDFNERRTKNFNVKIC